MGRFPSCWLSFTVMVFWPTTTPPFPSKTTVNVPCAALFVLAGFCGTVGAEGFVFGFVGLVGAVGALGFTGLAGTAGLPGFAGLVGPSAYWGLLEVAAPVGFSVPIGRGHGLPPHSLPGRKHKYG